MTQSAPQLQKSPDGK